MRHFLSIASLAVAAILALPIAGNAQDSNAEAQKLTDEAMKEFGDNKFDKALELLEAANKAAPDNPAILNFLGAVWTKKDDYPKAQSYFEKALAITPSFFPARFNMGEILFLQKKYAESYSHFKDMYALAPDNELLEFKLVLCELFLDQKDAAQARMKGMIFPGKTPAWYYAQAAWELKVGSKGKGRDYVKTAQTLYDKNTALYDETLKDAGLLK